MTQEWVRYRGSFAHSPLDGLPADDQATYVAVSPELVYWLRHGRGGGRVHRW